MQLSISDYELLPALIFVPSLFFLVLLTTLKLKTNRTRRLFIASTLSGFLGFAMSFILPFYEPLRFSYTLVPIAFFLLACTGIAGCLVLNVNPFDVKTPLFAPKPKKQPSELRESIIEEEDKPFAQTVAEANKLIELLLFKIGQPYQHFKQVHMPNGEMNIDFPFIVTSPNSLFLIYPCNWSGDIVFSNQDAKKKWSSPQDTEDFSSTIAYREAFFKKLLDTVGLTNTPVKSIICATNPSAVVKGEPSKYLATDLGDLASILKKQPANGEFISTAKLFDIQNAIELNQIKK